MTQSVSGATTVTYQYDHEGNRVKQSNGTTTTIYPNGYYDVEGSDVRRHLLAGALGSIATSTWDGTDSDIVYHHKDHLGGTHVETDESGSVLEYIVYKPFGGILTDVKSSTYENDKKYIGQYYDADTALSYFNARYYDSARGQFISQDPVHLAIGTHSLDRLTGRRLGRYLTDPQTLNSYSYARDNPIVNKDPEGRYFETAFDVAMFGLSLNDFRRNPGWGTGLGLLADGASVLLPVPAIVGGIRHGDDAMKLIRAIRAADRAYSSGKIFVSQNRLQHVLSRHTLDGAEYVAGKTSYFNPGVDVKALIDGAASSRGSLNSRGAYERVVDAGKNIGFDRATGAQTSRYTVITDGTGNLITSHPGLPSSK